MTDVPIYPPLVVVPFKVLKADVGLNVKTFLNFYQQRRWKDTHLKRIENGQVVQTAKRGGFFDTTPIGDAVDTDWPDGAPQVVQLHVEENLANVAEFRDRVTAYEADRELIDPDPLVQGGDPQWRVFGSEVNHRTIAWYAYRRSRDELTS